MTPSLSALAIRRARRARIIRRAFPLALGLALGLAAATAAHGQAPRPAPRRDPAAEFDAYAARAVRDWDVTGLAVAVVKDGRIVFARGYGVREIGKPAPVDTQTLFAIGSTTKSMTAAALALLVEEGKLRWDDPVVKHLPTFALGDPAVTREITVRDLLTHRTGLPNTDLLWYETDAAPAEVLRRVRFARPAYSLRSSFIYQNVMYAAAGAVVEAASGMPWDRFVRQRLFAPAGMTRAVTSLAEANRQANVAAPHWRFGPAGRDTVRAIENASVDAVAPAGAVWASVADMARWLVVVADSGRSATGAQVLAAPSVAELLRPQQIVPSGEFYPSQRLTHPHWTTYGLGWFQQDYAGRKLDFHTGSIDGMVAIAGIVADARFGVFVLANVDHAEVRHALLLRAVDTWLGTGTRDWSTELRTVYRGLAAQGDSARRAAEARRVPGTRPSLALERYAGTYGDSLLGDVTVTHEHGALLLRRGPRLVADLEPWHYDTFRATWRRRWQGADLVTFVLDARGEPAAVVLGGRELGRR
ncbi:MAG: serine hydrolase [Gemmatimonadaceae bacterium]